MGKTLEALVYIQGNLKAPKDQKGNRYRYRNIEDINEAVKPLAAEHGCAVVYSDEFRDGLCISTCMLIGPEAVPIQAQGVSMINQNPQHMSIEQSSGAASSYARKYAAQGLFAIDSSERDPDRTESQPEAREEPNGTKAAVGAKQAAIDRLNAAMEAFAARHGSTVAKVKAGIKKRPEFQDTADYLNMVAEELENE